MNETLEAVRHKVIVWEEDYPRAKKTVAQMFEDAEKKPVADAKIRNSDRIRFEYWLVEKGHAWNTSPSANHCESLNCGYELVEDLMDRYLNMRDFYILHRGKGTEDKYVRLGPFAIPQEHELLVEELIEFIEEMAQFEAKVIWVPTGMADFLFRKAQKEAKKYYETGKDATEAISQIPETLLARDPELEPTGE